MYDITAIKNYILFLKRVHGLYITLHINKSESIISATDLMTFNIHDNSYCIYIKSCKEAYNHCISRQYKIYEKCRDGSFTGVCYAGVREFVYPITHNGELNGFISVSGYKCENHNGYLSSVSEKYGFRTDGLENSYSSLKSEIPPKEYLDILITPLCNMLELAYIKTENEKNAEKSFPQKIIAYLKQYHTQNITSKDICEYFACSRSSMSHKFKAYTGMSIRDYINSLRVADAESLLSYSDLTVTEIALSVGFADSNYFTEKFKKIVGIAPTEYRKKTKVKQ